MWYFSIWFDSALILSKRSFAFIVCLKFKQSGFCMSTIISAKPPIYEEKDD